MPAHAMRRFADPRNRRRAPTVCRTTSEKWSAHRAPIWASSRHEHAPVDRPRRLRCCLLSRSTGGATTNLRTAAAAARPSHCTLCGATDCGAAERRHGGRPARGARTAPRRTTSCTAAAGGCPAPPCKDAATRREDGGSGRQSQRQAGRRSLLREQRMQERDLRRSRLRLQRGQMRARPTDVHARSRHLLLVQRRDVRRKRQLPWPALQVARRVREEIVSRARRAPRRARDGSYVRRRCR